MRGVLALGVFDRREQEGEAAMGKSPPEIAQPRIRSRIPAATDRTKMGSCLCQMPHDASSRHNKPFHRYASARQRRPSSQAAPADHLAQSMLCSPADFGYPPLEAGSTEGIET
jgi:hypothetical protein